MLIREGQTSFGDIMFNFDGKYFRRGSTSYGDIVANLDGKYLTYSHV